MTALGAAPATATEIVDDNRAQCPSAAHASIQAGVDAASPAEQVLVCNGVYQEAVTLAGPAKDGVQLVANTTLGATIRPPFDYAGPIILIEGADRVQVRRFRISGPFRSASGGCPASTGNTAGVMIDNASAAVLVRGNAITGIHIRASCFGEFGVDSGVGVLVRNGSRATVGYNAIEGYGHDGVEVLGDPSFALVDHNTLTAGASELECCVTSGVTVDGSAGAYVTTNRISRNNSNGVSFYGNPEQTGVARMTGNRIFDNERGIFLFIQRGALVKNNLVFDNRKEGILASFNSSANEIERNDFRGNGGTDCVDDSENPSQRGFPRYTTQNSWVNNKGLEANPPPICTATGNAGGPVP